MKNSVPFGKVFRSADRILDSRNGSVCSRHSGSVGLVVSPSATCQDQGSGDHKRRHRP